MREALTDAEVELLDRVATSLRNEMSEALRYFDPEALSFVSDDVAASARSALDRFGGDPSDADHLEIGGRLRRRLREGDGPEPSELILRGGSYRGFLG